MAESDEKLNSILANPDAMAQIMQLAQSLSGDSQGPAVLTLCRHRLRRSSLLSSLRPSRLSGVPTFCPPWRAAWTPPC